RHRVRTGSGRQQLALAGAVAAALDVVPAGCHCDDRAIIPLMRHALLLLLASSSAAAAPDPGHILFDDFSYASLDAFRGNGWIARSAQGWPGIEGATWLDTLTFVDDPAKSGNRLARMTATTDGTTTRQAQFCHQRKYLEGTYAARVRFSDA